MNWTSTTRQLLIITGLCLAAMSGASAQSQSLVSVSGSKLNMREGPGTNNAVPWELRRGYPLQVTQRKGGWVKVRDFEGDTGWVARSLTGKVPHHVVKSKIANVRSGPGMQHSILGKVQYGDLLRTREKRADWVRVEQSGGVSGWIARRLLWGF